MARFQSPPWTLDPRTLNPQWLNRRCLANPSERVCEGATRCRYDWAALCCHMSRHHGNDKNMMNNWGYLFRTFYSAAHRSPWVRKGADVDWDQDWDQDWDWGSGLGLRRALGIRIGTRIGTMSSWEPPSCQSICFFLLFFKIKVLHRNDTICNFVSHGIIKSCVMVVLGIASSYRTRNDGAAYRSNALRWVG